MVFLIPFIFFYSVYVSCNMAGNLGILTKRVTEQQKETGAAGKITQ